MSNIYFPDEEIGFNELFFVCYMIERTARYLKQTNRYVAEKLGKDALERQLSIAPTNHCLNPEQVVSDWVAEYRLESGQYDVTTINPQFTDKVPTDIQMGKVYARLVSSLSQQDVSLADTILLVYASPICETIDNYNTGAYYEPSYIHTRAFILGAFA